VYVKIDIYIYDFVGILLKEMILVILEDQIRF